MPEASRGLHAAHPVQGLEELVCVVEPGGQVLLLEHVRQRSRVVGWFFHLVNPVVRRVLGVIIKLNTEQNHYQEMAT